MSVNDADADIDVLCSDDCLSKIIQIYSDCGDATPTEAFILSESYISLLYTCSLAVYQSCVCVCNYGTLYHYCCNLILMSSL